MPRLIAYIGGIRSGKSRLAEQRFIKEVEKKGLAAAYLATLDSSLIRGDKDMRQRLSGHQARRPKSWLTLEVRSNLEGALKKALAVGSSAVFLDGLGMWVSLMLTSKKVPEASAAFAKSLKKQAFSVVVLDEAGQGGVQLNRLARRFSDLNGLVNQAVCSVADEVWRVDAGIAVRIK